MSQSTPPPSCPGCLKRDGAIAALQQQVAELRRQLDELRAKLDESQRAGKRQATPFRRRAAKANPKPPGRPPGHARAQRPLPDRVDRVIDVPCAGCPDCQVPLIGPTLRSQYQTDLPPVV